MTNDERIKALEERVAALELQLQEQPDTTFSDFMFKCLIHYQNQMTKQSHHPE